MTALGGEAQVDVLLDDSWSTDRITPAGREKLREAGFAPPDAARRGRDDTRPAPAGVPLPVLRLDGDAAREPLRPHPVPLAPLLRRAAASRSSSSRRSSGLSGQAAAEPPEAEPGEAEGEGDVDPGLVPLEGPEAARRRGRSPVAGSRAALISARHGPRSRPASPGGWRRPASGGAQGPEDGDSDACTGRSTVSRTRRRCGWTGPRRPGPGRFASTCHAALVSRRRTRPGSTR